MIALLLLPSAGFAAATKNVLILRGGAPDLPGGQIIVDTIQSTVRQQFGSPVDFYLETIDPARFSARDYERRLADLYAEAYGKIRLDLVVAFTGPAVDFVLDYRQKLFPHTPLLFGVIPPGLFAARTLPDRASVVYVTVDPVGTLRLAQATYPAAKRVLVVGGTSEFDRGWQLLVLRELRDFDPALAISYDFGTSLEGLIPKVTALPADTIVLYVSMTRDGADTPTRPRDVLQVLRAISRVPIYGLSSTYLGYGIVGGALLDFDRHGADLGRETVRILSGGHPQQLTTPSITAVDWRELQRFGMTTARLPASTIIAYRDPGMWQRYKWTVVTVVVVMVAQTALILALVRAGRRRREAQRRLERRLAFERLLASLSSSLSATAPDRIEAEVDAALGRIAADLNIEWVWRLDCDAPEAAGWDVTQLRAGQPALFAAATDLPPGIGEKLAAAGCVSGSSMAIPMDVGGVVFGAIFWVSRRGGSVWTAHADELRMASMAVANVLERKHAEGALADSDRLKGAILDSLPAHVAVLDREGTVIAVNDAWMAYGRARGVSSDALIGPGASYVKACVGCSRGSSVGCDAASVALDLIASACRGERTGRQVEYRCEAPGEVRWFLVTVEPLHREQGGAVVTHLDITERKLHEIALRESEDRFRRLADALPVAIWMSGVDAGYSYFNSQWLRMTGRSLDEEAGEGWLQGVHPDDRDACMDAYIRAFQTRQRFSMDYRLRQHDGGYRWQMDVGLPRYGSDGVFHGYVGGCVDITERMQAEQMFRDLNRRLLAAQDEERRRIARELHDHLSQQLALLAIDLQTLTTNPPATLEEFVTALQEDWRRTAEIASDVHAISHRLHPAKLEALGLVATIRAHCRDVSRRSLPVHFSEQNVPNDVPPDASLCLFRVLEEALNNVARHSGASEAHVALLEASPGIVLRVSDAGRGFAAGSQLPSGIGLVSMRERLQALGGTLSITSAPGKGTVVEARVPRAALVLLPEEPLDAAFAGAGGVSRRASKTDSQGRN